MSRLPLRQLVMGAWCFGMFSFLSVTVGDWIMLTWAVWLCTSGRTPRQAVRALIER
jgi:hypothetical protein